MLAEEFYFVCVKNVTIGIYALNIFNLLMLFLSILKFLFCLFLRVNHH